MNEHFNFIHNGFVIETESSYMTLEPTTYIIPYYAVKEIVEHENYVEVFLKSKLESTDSFNKRIYKIYKENKFDIYFDDEIEKQIFIKNIRDILKNN